MKRIATAFGFLLLLAMHAVPLAQAQTQTLSSDLAVQRQLSDMADAVVRLEQASKPHPEYALGGRVVELLNIAFLSSKYPQLPKHSFIAQVTTQQTKKQAGSTSTTSGSTSLIQKPLTSTLLGVALENGALIDDVSGNDLTLSSSPYALIASLAGNTDTTYAQYGSYARLGGSATFNITNTNDPLQDATKKQLAVWGLSLRLTPDISARSPKAAALFTEDLQPLQIAAAQADTALQAALSGDASIVAARDVFYTDASTKIAALLSIVSGQGAEALKAAVMVILTNATDNDLAPAIAKSTLNVSVLASAYVADTKLYIQAIQRLSTEVTALTKAPVASIFYNDQQQTGASNYSEIGGAYAGSPGGLGGDLTANAAAAFYTKPLAASNQQTFRSVSTAVQLNMKLKRSPFLGQSDDRSPIQLSFTGRYQRMQENRHVVGKKADIGEGNLKLEIPLAGGVSLPISMTFANAGQTVSESYVRGNFGLTFDLDKLASLVSK